MSKLKIVDVKMENRNTFFYVKDNLHITPTKFDIKSIDKKNIIKNLDSESSYIVGRMVNDNYRESIKFNKVDINDNGELKLYSSLSQKYKLDSHIDKILLMDDVVSNCTPEVIRVISTQKTERAIKKLCMSISSIKPRNNVVNLIGVK